MLHLNDLLKITRDFVVTLNENRMAIIAKADNIHHLGIIILFAFVLVKKRSTSWHECMSCVQWIQGKKVPFKGNKGLRVEGWHTYFILSLVSYSLINAVGFHHRRRWFFFVENEQWSSLFGAKELNKSLRFNKKLPDIFVLLEWKSIQCCFRDDSYKASTSSLHATTI